jgi:hypothetical protein
MSKDSLMIQLKTVSLALSFLLTASLAGLAGGQEQAVKVRYKEALQRAQAREFERAYEMAFKVVRGNEFYYEAQVLRIALAVILKKSGSEEPKNLIRVAKDYAPLGSNLEQDVQNLVSLLNATPSVLDHTGSARPGNEVAVSPYVRKRIALVVGIGSFKDPKINPLSFTSNDARAFAETLNQVCRFDDVRLLVDFEATRRNILTELEIIARTVKPDDLVVIYIASHGSPTDLDSAGVNYIVTHDSEVDNLYATSYKMKDLLDDIQNRIPAQRVVAFIDTCFSGATFKQKPSTWVSSNRGLKIESSGIATKSIEAELRKTGRGIRLAPVSSNDGRRQQDIGRIIIASSRQNQKAWESDSIKHGYFTYYLIQALRRDGAISVQGLYDYLSVEVPKAVLHDRNAEQNPTMVSSIEGPVKIFIK